MKAKNAGFTIAIVSLLLNTSFVQAKELSKEEALEKQSKEFAALAAAGVTSMEIVDKADDFDHRAKNLANEMETTLKAPKSVVEPVHQPSVFAESNIRVTKSTYVGLGLDRLDLEGLDAKSAQDFKMKMQDSETFMSAEKRIDLAKKVSELKYPHMKLDIHFFHSYSDYPGKFSVYTKVKTISGTPAEVAKQLDEVAKSGKVLSIKGEFFGAGDDFVAEANKKINVRNFERQQEIGRLNKKAGMFRRGGKLLGAFSVLSFANGSSYNQSACKKGSALCKRLVERANASTSETSTKSATSSGTVDAK